MGWKYLVMEECEGAGLEDADHTNVCTEKQKHQKQVLKRSKDFFFCICCISLFLVICLQPF